MEKKTSQKSNCLKQNQGVLVQFAINQEKSLEVIFHKFLENSMFTLQSSNKTLKFTSHLFRKLLELKAFENGMIA